MPNVFVNIPVPSLNAVGAAVDVSAMGRTKSIIVGGDIDATVTIEYATDLAGSVFAPLTSFQGGGNVTIDVAAHWMRARTSGYKSGSANADVGSSDSGSSFLQLVVPPGDGNGVPVDISALPEFKTVVVSGGFTGSLNVEVSEDGVDYAQAMTFYGGGGGSAIVYGAWARVSREGTNAGPVPSVWMGAASAAGGGGGAGPWQRIGTVISEVVPSDQVVVGSAVPAGLAPFSVIEAANKWFAVGSVDAFARRQLWFTDTNSVLRLGADIADGDAFDADSEGIVVYQPSLDYMARVKANRFGLTRASDASKYYFRVDDTQLFVRDRPTALLNLFRVDQATVNTFIGDPANPTGSMLFINQTGLFNSNAGIQHSSDFANRAAYRANQFGANAGIPGVVGFKSRGAIGVLASVNPGDVLWRATAIGVGADNVSIPLAGTLSINAPFVGANYVATDFEVALVPLAGPINSRRPVFVVDSEGVLHVKEGANAMAGVAVTGAGGTIVVPNTRITANTRITLTVQDGGVAPTNGMYVSARVVGASFTIQMIAAGDVGVQVYYQLYEPIP